MERKLTYFVSDVHLGLPYGDPAAREKRFVEFLRGIDPEQTDALYLLGDVWDFWYEYRDVVPRGYVRVLGALVNLVDAGVKVYFFQGNHDLWASDYFEELGMRMLRQPYEVRIGTKTFCLGHGDGLGRGNYWYKFVKWVFSRHTSRVLYSALHPWLAFRIAQGWSQKSRSSKPVSYQFKGADEPLYRYCSEYLKHTPVNFFIFGHYHSRVDMPVGEARLMMLGDWMTAPNWMVFNAEEGTVTAYSK